MVKFEPATDHELLDFVGQIYDCAIDPANWPPVLERLAGMVDGCDVAITLNSVQNPTFTMCAKWNIDANFEAAMLANYAINPLVPSVWFFNIDEPISVLSQIDETELRRTEWYRNTIGAYGYRDSAISLLAKSASQFGSLSIQRTAEKPPFSEHDLSVLRCLAPHVRRAVSIGDLLEARSLVSDRLSTALDLLTVGIVLANATGFVVHANAKAHQLFDEGSTIRSVNGALQATDAKSHKDLSVAILAAARGTTVAVSPAGITVALKGPNGRSHAAWVLPLDAGLRRELGASFDASAAIFIRELGDTSPIPGELFVRHYGITQAECRVLLAIVQGRTLQETADGLGISHATVKTHLSRLFQKTGTQRQTDLVRLAMTALAPARA